MGKKAIFILSYLLVVYHLSAQLCQGSLGDPIVNITFGAGPNPGPPLSAASTAYQYEPRTCPQDGYYTVRNTTADCNVGWHVLSSDHTGDPNGYFMLVNASNQPSAFYVDTVALSCSNTTYEFAAWVVNMNRPAECSGNPRQPNLTFRIETTNGVVLQTYNSGDISVQNSIVWRQYGFFFTLPPSINKVVLRITNNAPGGCGNDLALDDITFRPCGPTVNVSIAGSTGLVKNICEGEATQVVFNSTLGAGYASPFFQWQVSTNNGITWADIPGATTATLPQNFIAATSAGTYLFRLAVSKTENSGIAVCRVNSEVLTVKINAKPVVTKTNNGPLCEGATAVLTASGGTQYAWTGPGGIASATSSLTLPNVGISSAGRYYVTVGNDFGCQRADSIDLVIKPSPKASVNINEASICGGDSVQLVASGGTGYLWLPDRNLSSQHISDPFASPNDSTRYKVVVSNSDNCIDSAFVQINVFKKPVVNAGPDKLMIEGQQAQLEGSVTGSGVSFQWSPPDFINDVNRLQPIVNPPADKVYYLSAVSTLGCGSVTDSVVVKVFKGIFVPTAFTPNKDGKNDVWLIPGLGVYKDYQILVFNRYGQVVYSSKDAAKAWDGNYLGKPMPTGVYPYLIQIKQANVMLKGLVTIIR